jgi:small subunit ribosomal protein S6
MTIRYETLILANPEITSDEIKSLEENIERIVKKNGGELKSFERWGKYRLAYPVEKHEYGVYFLGRFEIQNGTSAQTINDLHTLFTVKFPQFIMRHMNTRLHPHESLAYQRPESLEEAPTSQDVEPFLRDNVNTLVKQSYTGSEKRGKPHFKHTAANISEQTSDSLEQE